MQETLHASPLCGFISNAKPLNEGDKCTNRSTTAFDYRGGKLYLCDYHAGCLGITLAEKKAELILRVYRSLFDLFNNRQSDPAWLEKSMAAYATDCEDIDVPSGATLYDPEPRYV